MMSIDDVYNTKGGVLMDLLSSHKLTLMQRSLDAASLRQQVISNNIANAEVPHFKRSYVRFEDLLAKQMQSGTTKQLSAYRTNARHLEFSSRRLDVEPRVVQDESTAMNNNQNNVDIDLEMANLAKNQMIYDALIRQVNHDIRSVRTAIGGRA